MAGDDHAPNDGRPVDGGRGSESAAPTGPDTPDGLVFDAEILTDAENEDVARRFAQANKAVVPRPPAELAHRSGEVARRAAVAVKRATGAAWRSGQAVHARSVVAYRARKAPRDLVRLMWFALCGHAQWMQKAWTFFTYGDLRADVRAARVAGNAEARRAAQ